MKDVPLHVLRRVLGVLNALEQTSWSDRDNNGRIHENLDQRIRRAPLSVSDIPMRLPPLPGFLLTKADIVNYVHSIVSVTYLDARQIPRYRKGSLTNAWPARIRIESLSGRGWMIPYGRILRVEVFDDRGLIKTTWFDLHEG